MSYNSIELSINDAKPIALYDFSIASTTWHYAASEDTVEVVIAGQVVTYQPLVIMDEGFSESGSPDNEEVKISLPRSTPVAQLFRSVAPSVELYITLRRTNFGTREAPIYWVGTVKSTKSAGLNQIELTCQMMAASFTRQGLRLGWQKTCNNSLYDRNCRVDPNLYATGILISALSGAAIYSDNIAGLTQSRYTGGYVEWDTAYGTKERRSIEQHVGVTFQLLEGTDGLTVGQMIIAYPGCTLTTTSCINYNNLANFGGIPHMPGKSPFDGNPVF